MNFENEKFLTITKKNGYRKKNDKTAMLNRNKRKSE